MRFKALMGPIRMRSYSAVAGPRDDSAKQGILQVHVFRRRQAFDDRYTNCHQRRMTSASLHEATSSPRVRSTSCRWLLITAKPQTSMPKASAKACRRSSIHALRCSKDRP